MQQEAKSEWLSPAEASAELGVKPSTVTGWAKRGLLPSIKTLGGHRRYRRADIERLLLEQAAS